MNIFDIESSPDREKALALMPPFDEKDVKLGNLKDPAKISEKISEARASHESDWLDKAALRPETANILAIGIYTIDKGVELLDLENCDGETKLLETWWERFHDAHKHTGQPWAGWNTNSFDIPMLILRSRILGVVVPGGLRKGRYFESARLIDLRDDWLMGRNPLEVKSSLGYVSKALGLEGKNGDGKDFGNLYRTDRKAALNYLLNDIWLTKAVAEKLGYSFKPSCETFEQWQAKYLDAPKEVSKDDIF